MDNLFFLGECCFGLFSVVNVVVNFVDFDFFFWGIGDMVYFNCSMILGMFGL